MADEKIIERIRKLLAMAEDKGASQNEVEIAMRRALHLLALHNLSRDDVMGGSKDEAFTDEGWSSITYGRKWCAHVVKAIAELYFCKYYRNKKAGGRVDHHFVGRTTNVLVARSIATSVCAQIKREGLNIFKEDYTAQTSFFNMAMYTIVARCAKMKKDAQENGLEGAGTGLMLRSAYLTEMEGAMKHLDEIGVGLTKSRGQAAQIKDELGAAMGKAAGERVALRPQLDVNRQKALTSAGN